MPGDISRYQLDYILVRSRYKNSVKNSCAYPGADADTDHNLVAMTMKLKLKYIKKRKQIQRRWNRDNIKDRGDEMAAEIEERLGESMDRTNEERWQNLKQIITEEAEKTIGWKQHEVAKKPWVTEEMINSMKERRRWKHQTTEKARTEYKRLNNMLRRWTDQARENWWSEQCRELEELQQKGRYDKVYKRVKELQKKPGGGRGNAIKDKDGNLLSDQNDVKARWKEYIEELYRKDEKPKELGEGIGRADWEDEGPGVLKEEVIDALRDISNNKAEGIDNIPAEFLKTLGEKATQELVEICQTIYNTGEWPEDFLQTIMVPIKKKPNATECGDYRTISLISHASKIVLKILTKRIQGKVNAINTLGEDQFGFRKGVGTREAIGSLRVLSERSIQHGLNLYVCYVDYEKAFDRIDWIKLMRALRRVGVDWKERRLIGNLYMGQSVRIRLEGELTEPGQIGRGVRQGCPLSPLLFNIYIEEVIRETMEGLDRGVKVGGQLIPALRFADDQAMIADSQKTLQELMDRLAAVSDNYGMRINIKKTKVMVISKVEGKKVNITVYGEKIEQVNDFCYLGSIITAEGRCGQDIRRRIAMAKEAFCQRKELMRSGLDRSLKKRMIKTLVWSVALYGAETWTLRKEDIRRLEAFEMWIWRRIERISYEEHVTNEEVLERVEEDRSIIKTIRKRQKTWIGHVLRGESLFRTVIEGRLKGKKTRGRPRMMFLDWMTKEFNENYPAMKDRAKNREEWRRWSHEPASGQRT